MVLDAQPVGEQETESILDDYQSMDLDINSLIQKFIIPIDKFRSRNAPNVNSGIVKQSHQVISNELQESRAHAFYRMLGLPVIAPNGKFFNPGFNPLRSVEETKRQIDISAAIPQNVRDIVGKRESQARARVGVFSRANLNASIYSLALATPRGQRQFMVMDESINPLENGDLQVKAIPNRAEFITKRYKKRDGSEIAIPSYISSPSHILRPFMTDPVISANLAPKSGSQCVLIAAPFLGTNDTEYERNKFVKRPGLEFILRLRLRQQNINEQNGISMDQINLDLIKEDISENRQREIAATLSNVGVDDADVKQVLEGAGLLELYTLNDLVKTYKGLINLYVNSIEIIERTYKEVIWAPLSNEGGPERGTDIYTGFILPKKFLDSWEIERRILQLNSKAAIAKTQLEIDDELSYSDFAISEFQNVANVFEERIQEAKDERARLEAEASNALRVIEYISGEVSGLGLIDVFAIYMALWSVPVSVLLDLIDDEGVQRLRDIKELETADVRSRASRIGSPVDAYTTLEKRIISILSYGDVLYEWALGTPNEKEGGDISRDSL